MRAFSYHAPSTLSDAFAFLDARTRPLAGGTDLLTLMKADLVAPERLVNVKALLPRGIAAGTDGLTIGALTTLEEIEKDAAVAKRYAALAKAAAVAASPQLRNMATIGGNLLQRPRCWYFRNPRLDCWLKGGEHCPARDGENRLHAVFGPGPCHAVHPSDLAPALAAFDAQVLLQSPRGERALPLEIFFTLPSAGRRTENVLAPDELIVSLRLPPTPEGTKSVYLKAMDRKQWAFALVAVAAVLQLEGRRVVHAHIVLGGVATIPWRAASAERALVGGDLSAATLERAAAAALEEALPLAHNAYKLPLARALVRRALESLAP